jgi:hypothetical protein
MSMALGYEFDECVSTRRKFLKFLSVFQIVHFNLLENNIFVRFSLQKKF